MRRWLALGVALVALVAAGFLWTRDRPVAQAGQAEMTVADADPDGEDASTPASPLVAPRSPLTDADREARRFDRLDKDGTAAITRAEYFVNRRKAYARLDADGDGTLSFDEYSAKAIVKFAKADRDGDGDLNRKEFAATAMQRRARAACPPVA